jgi:hypothetical protein
MRQTNQHHLNRLIQQHHPCSKPITDLPSRDGNLKCNQTSALVSTHPASHEPVPPSIPAPTMQGNQSHPQSLRFSLPLHSSDAPPLSLLSFVLVAHQCSMTRSAAGCRFPPLPPPRRSAAGRLPVTGRLPSLRRCCPVSSAGAVILSPVVQEDKRWREHGGMNDSDHEFGRSFESRGEPRVS